MQFVRKMRFIVALLVVVTAICAHLTAQQSSTSQVSGVVTDKTGAVVPGAQVQIANTETSAIRTAVTDQRGGYIFSNLPVGPYTLQVQKQGFEKYVQSGIVLQVNTNPAIMVTLSVGNVTQEVVVEVNAAMVETQTNSVTQVINTQQVTDLPLNGRQAEQLILLSGAAVNSTAAGGLIGTLDYPNVASYTIAGSQPSATNYYLDGGQYLDFRTNTALPMPFPDALSEFSLNLSAIPANLGIHPGGTVNAVTRSGGNSFHGNVFDFVRNGVMDATARTYATTETGVPLTGARDTLVRNQFGGTIGGPIRRDKLFFFAGYQGTMANSTTGVATKTLPTPAMLGLGTANPGEGDFTALLSGNPYGCTTGTINSAYTTSPGSNIVPASLMGGASGTPSAAIMANYIKNYIPANPATGGFEGTAGNCGTYVYTADPVYNYESQYVGRVDWQRTASDKIFGRYFLANFAQPSYYTAGNILSSSGVGLADRIQTVSIGDDYILSAHSINTVRLAFDRTAQQRTSNTAMPCLATLGIAVTCQVANNSDLIFGVEPGFEGWDYENSYLATEGWAWTNGRHQFNAGFNFLNVQMNGDGTFQEDAEIGFNTGTTGVALADEATGNADTLLQGMGQLSRDGQKQPSAYIQDAWKVLPRLQLTGGMRWDPFFAQHNKYGEVGDFSLAGYEAGTQSQEYVNAPPGMTFEGDPGFHGRSDTINYTKTFVPRVGFVWDMTGKGKETLRGGYGYFYDTSVLWNTMHIVLNPPWGETLSFTPNPVSGSGPSATDGVQNPFSGANGPNPFPFYNPPKSFVFPTNGTFIYENQSNKPESVQHWNLSYQRQLTPNMLLTVNYIGNKTSHVWLGISQDSASPYQFSTYGGGATGVPCTLPWGTGTYTFAVCNEPSGTTEYESSDPNKTVTNVNARRALNLIHPQYGPQLQGGTTVASAWGDGAYNGLLVSVEKRMSHGIQALGNYTWSRCMDDGEVGEDIGNVPMNPLNPKGSSWGDCTYDIKGIVNLNLVAQSPHVENRVVNSIVSSWSGSGIFNFNTGSHYTMSAGYDTSLTGVGSDRPIQVGNPKQSGTIAANPTCGAPKTAGGTPTYVPPAQVRTILHWYNPCAFEWAPLGTFSSEVKGDQVGPSNWNLNLAVWRSFPLPERIHLDFRAEAFNALNHTQIGNPSATLSSSSGAATSTLAAGTNYNANGALIDSSSSSYTPRIIQLAIKANF